MSDVRILDGDDVDAIIDDRGVIDAVEDMFRIPFEDGSAGLGRVDLRHANGWIRILPGYLEPLGVFGFKTLNRADTVGMRYIVYVHDLATGALAGIVDGLALTNMRTGSVTAVGTDRLAVPTCEVAALVGAGPVARGQAVALDLVRPPRTLRVYTRTPERREAFAAEMSDRLTAEIIPVGSLEEAIDGASVVTLATNATEPILRPEHLRPGMHVNSIGPATRDRRELATDTFEHFDRIVCDHAQLVLAEAGDAVAAVESDRLDATMVDDLGMVVRGLRPGRTSAEEITLFKSVGSGLQDLAVAARLLESARNQGIGTVLGEFVSVKPAGGGARR